MHKKCKIKSIVFALFICLLLLSCNKLVNNKDEKNYFFTTKNEAISSLKKEKYSVVKERGDLLIKDEDNNLYWESFFSSFKMSLDEAKKYCEKSDTAGYKNWRLPTVEELNMLINRNHFRPASDLTKIPTQTVWSSSELVYRNGVYFRVDFNDGSIYGARKNENYFVFCVRSGSDIKKNIRPVNDERFEKGEDRVVYDKLTDLQWVELSSEKEIWRVAMMKCHSIKNAGYSNWRLPDISELETLIDYKKPYTASNFPDIKPAAYWSSTEFKNDRRNAWAVYFNRGIAGIRIKRNKHLFICVRTGKLDGEKNISDVEKKK